MKATRYIKLIEQQIAEHQSIQANNPPTSQRWQKASEEIHRLAMLILAARKKV